MARSITTTLNITEMTVTVVVTVTANNRKHHLRVTIFKAFLGRICWKLIFQRYIFFYKRHAAVDIMNVTHSGTFLAKGPYIKCDRNLGGYQYNFKLYTV